jgi:ssRNA-specific RNase YbeY (16S rRNA maturation enzyme)
VERVQENAADFKVPLKRKYEVMVHGVLHCGYKDKGEAEELLMRSKEDEKLALFHVEQ